MSMRPSSCNPCPRAARRLRGGADRPTRGEMAAEGTLDDRPQIIRCEPVRKAGHGARSCHNLQRRETTSYRRWRPGRRCRPAHRRQPLPPMANRHPYLWPVIVIPGIPTPAGSTPTMASSTAPCRPSVAPAGQPLPRGEHLPAAGVGRAGPPARSGCGRPPANSASTATPSKPPSPSRACRAAAASGLAAQPLPG